MDGIFHAIQVSRFSSTPGNLTPCRVELIGDAAREGIVFGIVREKDNE